MDTAFGHTFTESCASDMVRITKFVFVFFVSPESEVQQFHKEVQDSVEVKFAVQAFAALNSNNFVRFFKLVKAASYLSGCILHRYFNQVSAHSKAKTVYRIPF